MFALIHYGAPAWDAITFFLFAEFTATFIFLNLIVSLMLYRLKKNLEEEVVQDRLEFLKDIENGIEEKKITEEVHLNELSTSQDRYKLANQLANKPVNSATNNNLLHSVDEDSGPQKMLVHALSTARLNKLRGPSTVDPNKPTTTKSRGPSTAEPNKSTTTTSRAQSTLDPNKLKIDRTKSLILKSAYGEEEKNEKLPNTSLAMFENPKKKKICSSFD